MKARFSNSLFPSSASALVLERGSEPLPRRIRPAGSRSSRLPSGRAAARGGAARGTPGRGALTARRLRRSKATAAGSGEQPATAGQRAGPARAAAAHPDQAQRAETGGRPARGPVSCTGAGPGGSRPACWLGSRTGLRPSEQSLACLLFYLIILLLLLFISCYK